MSVVDEEIIYNCLKEKIENQYKLSGILAYDELKDVNLKGKICTEVVNETKNKNGKIDESIVDYILEKYTVVLESVNNYYHNTQTNQSKNDAIYNQEKLDFGHKENNYNGLISGITTLLFIIWKIIKFCFGIVSYVAYFIISLIFGLSKKYK